MDRRRFLVLVLGTLATPPTAGAQPAGKLPRIGILIVARTGDIQVEKNFGALQQGLGERGWILGQNIAFEYRWADGRYDRLPTLAAELVHLKVNAIVGATTPLIAAVKKATETIPIIMVAIFDPVGAGFVSSLAHPGGNITGLTFLPGPGLVGKQLELVKQAVPAASYIAILTNPANPGHAALIREAEAAARTLKVRVESFGATSPDDFDTAFAAMNRQQVDGLLVLPDAGFYTHRRRIVDLATKSRLPAIYGFREPVIAGGLLAYGPSIPHQWSRAAYFVDRILKGAKPADLPVEQPTKFELVVNMKTARTIGLTIPPSLLLRADQVIE